MADPAPSLPAEGDVYRHPKGGLYRVVANAWEEASHRRVVVYRSLETGIVWTRPFGEWRERFTREDPQPEKPVRYSHGREA